MSASLPCNTRQTRASNGSISELDSFIGVIVISCRECKASVVLPAVGYAEAFAVDFAGEEC